jgi:RND superfamily putative drug exporter
MTRMLHRLGRLCGTHPWRVAVLWLLLLGAVTGASVAAGGSLRDTADVPGTSSARATAMLRDHFPDRSGAVAHVVARAAAGLPAGAIDRTVQSLRSVEHVQTVTPSVTPDGRSALIAVQFAVGPEGLDLKETTAALTRAAAPLREASAQVAVGGQVPEGVQGPNGVAEAIGVAVAIVLLILVFGSLLAAGLPLLMALVGIGVGMGLIGLLAAVADVSTVSPTLGSMLGLGVGIDYSLLIIARYRDELGRGSAPLDAVAEAVATAGHAVVFAGLCVLIGILGLAFSGIPSFTTMGLAAGLVVLATMLAATTLLPAILVPAGRRVLPRRAPRGQAPPAFRSAWAERSTGAVVRRPVLALAAGLTALGVIAAPVAGLRLGQNDAGSEPLSNPTRQAYDLVAQHFGPGWNGPLAVVVDRARVDDTSLASRMASRPDVADVMPPLRSADGTTAVLTVVPRTGPQDAATYELVRALHRELPGGAELAGPTATTVDMTTVLQQRLWLVILVVLAATCVLLVAVVRSLVLAVKAVLANLLSVAASFGALTVAFQTSPGSELLGLAEPVPIVAWAPVVLFAILFGLSTDYEVFMLSRVREAYDAGLPHREAVVEGLASSAKVITCAAAIMIAVAAGFAADPAVMVKIVGVGLAVAIFLDVTLVRMLVVPAVLALLGDRTWYLPGAARSRGGRGALPR